MNTETRELLEKRLKELGCTLVDTRGDKRRDFVLAMRDHSHDRFIVWAVCDDGQVVAGDYCNDIKLAAKWLYERAGTSGTDDS